MRAVHDAITQAASGERFAVGFTDLDDFKSVNDTLGHDAGDELWRQLGARLRESVRKVDVVARLAGDEFVLLLRELDDGELVEALAKRTLAALEQPFVLKGLQVRVGASLGGVLSGRDMSAQEVIATADRAMYQAKRQGKNHFFIHDCR